MNCTLLNVDWCFIAKSLFLNWYLIIGMIIIIPIILYFKYKWQIRAWQIKKLNPKHVLTAIFLNKEGCISILPMKIEEQKIFNFQNETYTTNKKAIFRSYKFKESINDITEELDTFAKEYKLPEKNIVTETAQKLRKLEKYSMNEKGVFHLYHGKRWFWRKESTGRAYSIYLDGVPMPLNKDYLLNKTGKNCKVKWDSNVIYELANQTFLRQFLTDSNKVNWKMMGFFLIGLAIAGYMLYQYKATGKLI